MRPMGMLRCGSLVSSAAVATASKPTYAKKIDAAAPATPTPRPVVSRKPFGAKGWKLAPLMTGIARMTNTVNATTLMATSTEFTVALSRVPMTSSAVTNIAMAAAGRLMRPPAYMPLVKASGKSMPKERSMSPTK